MKTQHLSYEFVLLPERKQVETLNRILRDCADIYNGALEYIRITWNASGSWEHFKDIPDYPRLWYHHGERLDRADCGYNLNKLSKLLTELRNEPEHGPEWSKTSRVIQRGVLDKLDRSMKAFFKRCKEDKGRKGFPRFKPLKRYRTFDIGTQSNPNCYQIQYSKCRKWAFLTFKGMPGRLRVFLHRTFPEKFEFKNAQITKVSETRWKVSFAIAIEVPETTDCKEFIGLDAGIKHFMTCDDGNVIDKPKHFQEAKAELRRNGRSLSRKKKGSRRRRQAARILANTHRLIANQRTDFHHKAANEVVAKAKTERKGIAAEDLQIPNLMKNRRLAASIADAGWGNFLLILEYKASIAGIPFRKVDPRNTSQLCSRCGTLVPKKLKVRVHNCHNCGLHMDRDQNAAMNIGKRATQNAESDLCVKDRSLSPSVKRTRPFGLGVVNTTANPDKSSAVLKSVRNDA